MADDCVHVVGAGLAGLSAAVRLTERGFRVVLHEANPFAGGRCRSFHDPRLGRDIDNGNHLLLSGNRSARAYLDTIGATSRMQEGPAHFPFVDLADGTRWTVAPNAGPLHWWIVAAGRRVPGTRVRDYIAALRLALAINNNRGNVEDGELAAARSGGLTDGEIAEVVGVVSLNIFTNYFNHVADPQIDFPVVKL